MGVGICHRILASGRPAVYLVSVMWEGLTVHVIYLSKFYFRNTFVP